MLALALAITVKLLAEIALLALAGQWAIGLLAGPRRDANPVYRVLEVAARPWLAVARWLSPKIVLDRHLPWVAGLMLLLMWGGASVAKVRICLQIGVSLCK